jgi:hypothetical protein
VLADDRDPRRRRAHRKKERGGVKRMNGKILELEPGTIGYQNINVTGINKALNQWAKRRGISWENRFNRDNTKEAKKRTRP